MNDAMLSALYPPLAGAMRSTIGDAFAMGLPPCDIFMGLRTFEEQDGLYALGRTKRNPDGACPAKPMGNTVTRARGGESWHGFGLAADLVFRPGGKWSWDSKLPWVRLGRIGEAHGAAWGNAIGPDKMEAWDQPHFQMTGKLDLKLAKILFLQGGLRSVWDRMGS